MALSAVGSSRSHGRVPPRSLAPQAKQPECAGWYMHVHTPTHDRRLGTDPWSCLAGVGTLIVGGVQLRDSTQFFLSLQAGLWDAPSCPDHSLSVLLPLHTLLVQPWSMTFFTTSKSLGWNLDWKHLASVSRTFWFPEWGAVGLAGVRPGRWQAPSWCPCTGVAQ